MSQAQINADDVPVLQRTVTRDAVNDLFIHGHTNMRRISLVPKKRGHHVPAKVFLFHDCIKIKDDKARANLRLQKFQHLGQNTASFVHDLDLFVRFNDYWHVLITNSRGCPLNRG